jgi:hypothetical protein
MIFKKSLFGKFRYQNHSFIMLNIPYTSFFSSPAQILDQPITAPSSIRNSRTKRWARGSRSELEQAVPCLAD